MFEVGVVVKDDSAVMFGNGSREQVDHASGAVVASGSHSDLDCACSICDGLGDRKIDVVLTPSLGDQGHVSVVAARVAGLEVNGDAGRGTAVCDQTGDHSGDPRIPAACLG
jgi:hypothetical protein